MFRFTSFRRQLDVMVVGAGGAIGGAFVDHLASSDDVRRIFACSRAAVATRNAKIAWRPIDILDDTSIAAAAEGIAQLDLLIVATGQLQSPDGRPPEKSWRSLNAKMMSDSYAINAIGPALVAKHMLPLLPKAGRAVFAAMSARVGSISDNNLGGWYSYRASKAALNQVIRTLSIELGRRNKDAICIGLHPGTVDSRLSRPFQGGVAPGKLFTPAFAAEHMLGVIDRVEPIDSGALFAWDGSKVEP